MWGEEQGFVAPKIQENELQQIVSQNFENKESDDVDERKDQVVISKEPIKQAIADDGVRLLLQDIIADLENHDLSNLKSETDLIQFIVDFGLKHEKKIDPDMIRSYFKATGLEIDTFLKNGHSGKWKHTEFALKVGTTIAGVLAVHWFAGPYMAIASRDIYTTVVQSIWGIPSAWNPSYWLVFLPAREHCGALAYQYGPYIANAIGASTLFYRTVDGVKYLGNQVSRLCKWATKKTLPVVEVKTDLSDLVDRMSRLKLDDTINHDDFGLKCLFDEKRPVCLQRSYSMPSFEKLIRPVIKNQAQRLAYLDLASPRVA